MIWEYSEAYAMGIELCSGDRFRTSVRRITKSWWHNVDEEPSENC